MAAPFRVAGKVLLGVKQSGFSEVVGLFGADEVYGGAVILDGEVEQGG